MSERDTLIRKIANLARQKQRARRRGDPNFYRISREHKDAKKKLENMKS